MKKTYIALLALILAACGASKGNDVGGKNGSYSDKEAKELSDILNTDRAKENLKTERPVFHASETIYTDLIHTKLDIRLDWAKAYLYGKATIDAKPHFYATDSLVLDAKGMEIKSVNLGGKELSFVYKDDILTIKLDRVYTRHEKYQVVIDYVAKPNERKTGGSSAITSDKGLYFINPDGSDPNKMPQIWTQGETEASSAWFPTIDAPNVKTSQEVIITVEDKYVTLSNGKLIASKKNSDGTRTDHWKQELPHAPYLFMLGVGEFKIVKDHYVKADGSKIEVNYYVEPEWEKYARAIFGETPRMIKFFSEKLGVEYPWDKYHQIVVREYVSGAMENTGAVVFGDFVYNSDRELLDGTQESIIAHELFHHWFGDLVTCESWSNLPMNESFANYSQYLWDEFKYGADEADFHASSEASGYFQQSQAQGHHDLIWYDYDEKEEMFDGHSYNKGGRILHMLRNYVGDEAFFLALNKYLTDNKYKAAEYHHLRLAFEEVTGEDLNWFFQQWFTAKGHPELKLSQALDGNMVSLKVEQTQNLAEFPIYKLPVEVAVVDDAGTHVHKITIDQIEQVFKFPVQGNLKTLIFDYQEALLAVINESGKSQDQFIKQYYASKKWRTRNRAISLGTKKIDDQSLQLILDALNDPFWNIRVNAIERAFRLKDQNKVAANSIIVNLAQKDPKSAVRAAALTHLEKVSHPDKENIYLTSLNDSSYLVVSTALKYLGKTNSKLAMEKAAELENEPSTSMMVGIAGLYAESKDPKKLEYFTKALTSGKVGSFDELGMLNLMTSFASNLDAVHYDKVIDVYTHLNKSGGMYAKMFLSQNISYLQSVVANKLASEKTLLADNEKVKDEVAASQNRTEITRLEAIAKRLESIIQ